MRKKVTEMRESGFGNKKFGSEASLGSAEPDGEDCFKRTEYIGTSAFEHECYCDDIKNSVALRGDTSTFMKVGSLCWTDC